tara:strand:+ start:1487 stop:2866 length:1380 start_codon:yes stop_codon:yes gene_type:complete
MALTQISTAGVKDDAVTAGKIPANAVGSSELADNAVDTAAVADNAVTTAKIADNAITNGKMADNAINTAELVDGSITTAKIANDAVTTAKIADDAVTSAHLASNSVNTAELIDGAVTQTKISDQAIINAKIDNSAAIAGTKISPNFGSQNIETTGTLAVDGEFQPHWIGHQSQCTENTHNTTVYWKVAEITGSGTEGGTIDFYGTDSYSSNSGNYAAGRTTLIVRHTTDNKLDGIYWSESGGWTPVRDICWKYTGSNNKYEIWVKKGAYNNVIPHITGSFDHVQTFGSSTGSGTLPSGATAFDNRWSLKMKDDSSDAISVDNEGLVTYPTRPCFHGGNVANTSSSNIVEYDVVHVNRGSHYATSNDRFVCPCDGIYYVSLFGMSYNSQGTMDIALRKNGSDYHGLVPYSASGGGTYHHVSGAGLVSCSENDYLQVHVGSGSMYGASNGRHTGFTVFLVG